MKWPQIPSIYINPFKSWIQCCLLWPPGVTQYCGVLSCVGVLIEQGHLLYIYMCLGFLSLMHVMQDQGNFWFDSGSQAHLVSNAWWIHMSELHRTTSWDACHQNFNMFVRATWRSSDFVFPMFRYNAGRLTFAQTDIVAFLQAAWPKRTAKHPETTADVKQLHDSDLIAQSSPCQPQTSEFITLHEMVAWNLNKKAEIRR